MGASIGPLLWSSDDFCLFAYHLNPQLNWDVLFSIFIHSRTDTGWFANASCSGKPVLSTVSGFKYFAYPYPMAVRTCRVSCWDPQGVEHTAQVTAQSLYEAVAQALRVFREDRWSEDPNRGPAASW